MSSSLQEQIANWITAYNGGTFNTGGCRPFYTPAEWKNRGEDYGTESVLVLVHDGGDLARFCNSDYADLRAMEDFRSFLKSKNLYLEGCTCWYSAIYETE